MQRNNNNNNNQDHNQLGANQQQQQHQVVAVQYNDETNNVQQPQHHHLLPRASHSSQSQLMQSNQQPQDGLLFEYQFELGLVSPPNRQLHQHQPASRKVSNCSMSSQMSSTSSTSSGQHYHRQQQTSELQNNFLQPLQEEAPLASYHIEPELKSQAENNRYAQDQFQYQGYSGDVKQHHYQHQSDSQGHCQSYTGAGNQAPTNTMNLNHQASYSVSFQETQMIETLPFNTSQHDASPQHLYHNNNNHQLQQQQGQQQVISDTNLCHENQNGAEAYLQPQTDWYSSGHSDPIATATTTKLELACGPAQSYQQDCGQDLNNNNNNNNNSICSNDNNNNNDANGYHEPCYRDSAANEIHYSNYGGQVLQDINNSQSTGGYVSCFDENQQQQQYDDHHHHHHHHHHHQQQQPQHHDTFHQTIVLASPLHQQVDKPSGNMEPPLGAGRHMMATGELLGQQGRRGRPRKRVGGIRQQAGATGGGDKANGKLWEFIRDLLLNERTNPSYIRWERHEDGVFKFVQSDKVAKMWGERKQNPKMTYEKLSRAMRYYYKSRVLMPVLGRRLVYKFGPNATGWMPARPPQQQQQQQQQPLQHSQQPVQAFMQAQQVDEQQHHQQQHHLSTSF